VCVCCVCCVCGVLRVVWCVVCAKNGGNCSSSFLLSFPSMRIQMTLPKLVLIVLLRTLANGHVIPKRGWKCDRSTTLLVPIQIQIWNSTNHDILLWLATAYDRGFPLVFFGKQGRLLHLEGKVRGKRISRSNDNTTADHRRKEKSTKLSDKEAVRECQYLWRCSSSAMDMFDLKTTATYFDHRRFDFSHSLTYSITHTTS